MFNFSHFLATITECLADNFSKEGYILTDGSVDAVHYGEDLLLGAFVCLPASGQNGK